MKNVLLYGDSFFWGVNAQIAGRHDFADRIGTICQTKLGAAYNVVTEGLRGRTMYGENGWFPERDGLAQFGPIFASHLPLDVVVIMLGTNDLNTKTKHDATSIALALDQYKEKMKFWCEFMKYDVPELILISPPEISAAELTVFKDLFEGSAKKIGELKQALRNYASQHGHTFLDAAEVVKSYGQDGIHLSAEENKKLAQAISELIT